MGYIRFLVICIRKHILIYVQNFRKYDLQWNGLINIGKKKPLRRLQQQKRQQHMHTMQRTF